MMEHDNVKKKNIYTCICNWVTMLYSRKKCIGEIIMKKKKDAEGHVQVGHFRSLFYSACEVGGEEG